MTRTTIMLPTALKARASKAARRQGVSLAEFIRESLEVRLRTDRSSDPLFAETPLIADEWPADVASNHDKYLLAIAESERTRGRRRTTRKAS